MKIFACEISLPLDEVVICSLLADLAVLEHHDVVRLGQVGDAVGDEHARLAGQHPARPDHALEDVLPYVGVHSGQGVIQQEEFAIWKDCFVT